MSMFSRNSASQAARSILPMPERGSSSTMEICSGTYNFDSRWERASRSVRVLMSGASGVSSTTAAGRRPQRASGRPNT